MGRLLFGEVIILRKNRGRDHTEKGGKSSLRVASESTFVCGGNVLEGRHEWHCRWGKSQQWGVESGRGASRGAGQALQGTKDSPSHHWRERNSRQGGCPSF